MANRPAAARSTGPRRRVLLRPPTPDDLQPLVDAMRASRALHKPWVSPPDTPARFVAWQQAMQPPAHQAFLVCCPDDGCIVGVVNLTNVVLGVFRSGYLGYYALAGHEGQGWMTLGLRAVSRHAFKVLKLHRLEANIQPGNTASIALVAACGFRREGHSPRYLRIGGRWRDHERWALLADGPRDVAR